MKDKKKVPSPLFWNISPESQAVLMQYQWDNFGERLDLPPKPKEPGSRWDVEVPESIEEIDQLMRKKPHPEGAGWRG